MKKIMNHGKKNDFVGKKLFLQEANFFVLFFILSLNVLFWKSTQVGKNIWESQWAKSCFHKNDLESDVSYSS